MAMKTLDRDITNCTDWFMRTDSGDIFRPSYFDKKLDQYFRENFGIDPAILAEEKNITVWNVLGHQRCLKLRTCTNSKGPTKKKLQLDRRQIRWFHNANFNGGSFAAWGKRKGAPTEQDFQKLQNRGLVIPNPWRMSEAGLNAYRKQCFLTPC